MASLFNTRISDTYQGLIKTIDNAAITATLKELTDGSGNSTGISLNNAGDFKVNAILEFGSLKDTGENIIITKFVDEADGIANNDNDTSIPTTAAIVDYVAAQITIEDLDFTGDTGSGQIDLDSQIFAIGGTTNEITTVASGQSLTLSLDSTGVNLPDNSTAITQTAGDNSTKIATTSYVDTLDSASDLDFSGDSGTGDVNLNTQTLAITGTADQIESTASNQGLSLQFPSAGVTLPNGSVATTQSTGDNSTKVATTAYVDTLDAASDLDITDGTNTGDINLNTQSLSILGTTNEIDSVVSGQSVTLGLPSSISTNLVGNVTGDLTGDVTGNVTGNLTGNSAGTHTGAVIGNVTGNVNGDLTGNADTATAWETARDLSLTGQATGTISSVDGTGNVSGALTLDNNSVTGKVLTGLTSPSASSVLATDTIVEGFGKLQSQVNGLAGGLRFMGSWDADTNSPVLSSGGGEAANGTTTSTTANKLVDSTANFTSTVTVGDQVVNQVDGTTALVSNVDSNTTLSLDNDIMLSGEAYTIDNSPFITQGHYYVVSVGGTTSLNGVSNWTIGDWVIAGANNQWTKLDHSQVDGTGTTGNLTKWSSTSVIADSIVSESGTAITVDGSLTTNTNLSSTGNFAVNTDKFTVAASSGNTAFTGDLAINTNKFTVNATSGNTLVAGTLDVTGKSTFGDDITISDSTPILDFEDTDNTDSNWRMEAKGSFGGFFFQSFDNNFQTGSTVLFAKTSNGYIGLGGNTNPQAQLDITGGLITSGNATFAGDITFGDSHFIGDDADDNLLIQSSANENIIIDSLDKLLFRNSGTTNLTINGSGNATFAGNVGIGETSPLGKLHVKTTDTASTASSVGNLLVLEDNENGMSILSSTAGAGYILFGDSGDNDIGGILYDHSTNSMRFRTNGVWDRMRIDSLGNVGIGASTIGGDLHIERTASSPTLLVKAAGQTGSLTPTATLILAPGSSSGYSTAPKITGYRTANFSTSALRSTGLKFSVSSANAQVDAMWINEAGNVGIGTDSPLTKLDIRNGELTVRPSSSGNGGLGKIGHSSNNAILQLYDSSGNEDVRISTSLSSYFNGGNVGIGTATPDTLLQATNTADGTDYISYQIGNSAVNANNKGGFALYELNNLRGSIEYYRDGSGRFQIAAQGAGNPITFATVPSGGSLTERMRITGAGDIQIPTNSAKIQFRGSGSASYSSIFRDASNFIQIANTAGTNIVSIGNGGDVDMPSGSLNVGGNAIVNNLLTINIDDISTGENRGLKLYNENSTGQQWNLTTGITGVENTSFCIRDATNDVNAFTMAIATGHANFSGNVALNDSGQLQLGTGNDVQIYHNNSHFFADNNKGNSYLRNTSTGDIVIRNSGGGDIQFDNEFAGNMLFNTSNVERMRITSGGNIDTNSHSGGAIAYGFRLAAQPGYSQIYLESTSSDSRIIQRFYNPNGNIGNIIIAGSTTSYNTVSDYRLKEDLQDFAGLDIVSKIPVYDFKWKTDESRSYGVMAHELQEVLPDAVTGEKDAEEMQGVDYSKIVPLLVKSIQELKAEVGKLKQECKCKN